MNTLKFYFKIIKYYLTNNIVSLKDISKSFNKVSANNNSLYLNKITPSSIPMLEEIISKLKQDLISDLNILDIGCGCGFNSKYLHNQLKVGSYTLVDISNGMLNKAKNICSFNCTFIEDDMLSYLNTCDANSMDVIICTYSISYHSPKKLIKQCSRVLKNGGFFGVIESLRGTLPELKNIPTKILITNNQLMNKSTKKLPYPRNEYLFEKMFVDCRFNRINLKSESHTLYFNNNDNLCNFITSSGILSPLDSVINLDDSDIKYTLTNLLDSNSINSLTHKYIWASFRNDK